MMPITAKAQWSEGKFEVDLGKTKTFSCTTYSGSRTTVNSYKWEVMGSNIEIVSSNSYRSCTIKGLGETSDYNQALLLTINFTQKGYYGETVTQTDQRWWFVKVVKHPVTSISINLSSTSLMVGETQQLSATVSPSNATTKSVTWSSDNSDIAEVSSNGLVTGKSVGNTTIICKANDGSGVSATCTVTVTDNPTGITDVQLTPTPDDVKVYDLQGRRLAKPVKGINIIDGKKVVIR